jgi:NAD(P)-dependent dehydrogenase (short-subunit alcohol dehydrogenase family)
MLLENKNAVIYGVGGSIGGAVARAFAREGAKVHLAGLTHESLEEVAEEIRSAGGVAETARIDAITRRPSAGTLTLWPRVPEVSTSPSTSSRSGTSRGRRSPR